MKKPRVVVTEPRTSRWGLLGGDVCSAAGMRSWWMSCWLWRRWHCNVVWVFGIVICYNCDTRDRSVRTSLKQSLIFSWLVVKLEAWLILCDVSLWAHLLTPYHMFGRWCQIEGANNHRFAILPQSVSFCFRQPLSLRSNPSTKRGFMLVTFKSPPPPGPTSQPDFPSLARISESQLQPKSWNWSSGEKILGSLYPVWWRARTMLSDCWSKTRDDDVISTIWYPNTMCDVHGSELT